MSTVLHHGHEDRNPARGSSPAPSSKAERREASSTRVQFEALVDVGAGSVGGFEAESLDVSPEGMRLRTAYLPALGEKLVCRFDGFRGEVVTEGKVIWCKRHQRGGEFGVRFTRLAPEASAMLDDICEIDGEAPVEPSDPQAALIGSRVRLHIQGLGSPMRARVRDVARGEVLIGSNLEFLRVGRGVEIEDVEQGRTRLAQIDHVSVEVDEETQVPQLVVSLRYDARDAPGPEPVEIGEPTTAPFRAEERSAPTDEITPSPTVIGDDAERPHAAHLDAGALTPVPPTPAPPAPAARTPAPRPARRAAHRRELDESPITLQTPVRARGERHGEDVVDDDDAATRGPSYGGVGKLARRIGPSLVSAGAGARGVLGKVWASVRVRRDERAARRKEESKGQAPRRRTAPPPSGALRSDGRRLFREQSQVEPAPESDPAPSTEAPRGTDKKRAILGAALGVLGVFGVYSAANALATGGMEDPPAAAVAPAEAEGAGELPPDLAPPPMDGAGIATAKVPLFGATPMSTTEPVPVPPGLDGAAAPGDEAEQPGEAPTDDKPLELQKEWGAGSIKSPTVLRLKMDGTIAGFAGNEDATGFKLVVPGRKSVSSGTGLAGKDKRLDAVKVVNYPDRSEISVHFKGETPPFNTRVNGNQLLIEIGESGKKKTETTKTTKKAQPATKTRSKIRKK